MNYSVLLSKPDIVIHQKNCDHIDGAFWHGHKWKVKKKRIKANQGYWILKIERNIKRAKKDTNLWKSKIINQFPSEV